MTTQVHEQLSALLDGELPDAEAEMAVRRLTRDAGLRSTALRYSLIGDAMRDELPAARPADLVDRVRAELDRQPEPVPATAAPARSSRFARAAGGFAVAASVAVAALVALPGRQIDETPPPTLSATEVASPAPEQRFAVQSARAAGGGPDRLTRYYVNHTEYAPPMSGRGALTRIIVIQPEATQPESMEIEASDAEDAAVNVEETGNAR
ncbi:sigma-E factor negative regulatory protein [Wenzhouxiangella sp. XN24]|uniref:sigma-E factor negative regulatory protein n=1 Tax=Wenzhouxiangella sp. XN24 TaxID=2713569 RepID=UPI0013EC43F9|nr:sigma-E factor negative regulatory protein [Wenzhouxiangella sp. XN24]NGX16751.1 sigma-E factor negative regulatory protein [Wenzhouxiangella sp. XN24]